MPKDSSLITANKRWAPRLLEPIGTVIIPATEGFVVRERFVVADSPVRIAFVAHMFQNVFCSKVEDPTAEETICCSKLLQWSVDGPILAELGDCAETKISQIYELMLRQANGKKGVLVTIGNRSNIFYVKDVNDVLYVVYVFWHGDGWGVAVDHLVESPCGWSAGNRVFSHN